MIPIRLVGAAVALAMIAAGAPLGSAVAAPSQVIEMPDGLKYTDTKVGDGAVAAAGDKVSVDYTGWLYKDGASLEKTLGERRMKWFATFKSCLQNGMTVGGGFWSGGLIQAGMKKGDFDVQFWPKWASQRHQLGVGGAWILKGGPNEDMAFNWLKFNTQTSVMNMITYFQPGNVTTTPVRRSMNTADRYGASGPENWHVFYDTLDKLPDTGPIPAPKTSIQETDIWQRYTASAVTGQLSPKDALDGMEKELEAMYAANP